jgi:prefoldin subunit 5
MDDALAPRVDALERAITDGDADLRELTAEAEALDRLADIETTLDELDERIQELEAATQALRGYVGNIRSVNQDVEQRAEAALSKAEATEAALRERKAAETGATEAPSVADEIQGPLGSANAECETTPATTAPPSTTAKSSPDAEQAGSAPSTDGGAPAQDRVPDQPDRCHACGRAHTSDAGGPHTSDAGGRSSPGAGPAVGSGASETTHTETDLVPEEDTDTGTLRRIRELL